MNSHNRALRHANQALRRQAPEPVRSDITCSTLISAFIAALAIWLTIAAVAGWLDWLGELIWTD